MTTENFKVGSAIVATDNLGDKIGYYIETKEDMHGTWVYFSLHPKGSKGVYVRPIENVRAATKEEANTLNG